MANKTLRVSVPALLLLLAACGDSSAPSLSFGTVLKASSGKDAFNVYVDSLCDEIGAGATTEFSADTTCVNCASESDTSAVDGTDATFATLTFARITQGPIRFRATAQSGIVYPAGSLPSVTFSAPDDVNFIRVEIRTYLQGVEQERVCHRGADFNQEDRKVIGLEATKPFDAVEASLQRTNIELPDVNCGGTQVSPDLSPVVIESLQIRVHEFCHEFRSPAGS